MTAKYTPSPWQHGCSETWTLDTEGENTYFTVGKHKSDDGEISGEIAIVAVNSAFGKDHLLDANTRLIVAAPDMADAIREFVDFCETEEVSLNSPSYKRFKAVLAKIDGA